MVRVLNASWLETFTTLCDIGHFTRTADRLAMTQPGVSQHIRKLEQQVGQPLILREGKSFTLTPAGEELLSIGRARRTEERALRERMQRDDPLSGTVRIGCSGSFALRLYPHLIARMQGAPKLKMHLSAAPQARILADILAGTLDLGVVTAVPDMPRVQATPLSQEELCLVLPATFNAADLTLQRLDDLGFIAHPDGNAYADDLLGRNFDDYRGAEHLRLRSFINQIGQIPLPVAQGLGYTILPRSGVEGFAHRDALAVHTLPQRRFHDLWLIARKDRAAFARVAATADGILGLQ
jgi:DNA-binding transcriptional LysR family regulator